MARQLTPAMRCGVLVACALPTNAPADVAMPPTYNIIAVKSIEAMPADLALLFREHIQAYVKHMVEPSVDWPRDKELKRRNGWHHVEADLGVDRQTREARLKVFREFPREESAALRVYRRAGRYSSGVLPWAIDECRRYLVEAFRTGDVAACIAWSGHLAHFAADAASPFRCSVNIKGAGSGNPRFGAAHGLHPQSPDHSIRERFGTGLVARYAAKYTQAISLSPEEYEDFSDPVAAAFDVIGGSLSVLDELSKADREILDELGITDRRSFDTRSEAYYAALDARCGRICIARLKAGAALAGTLIDGAWRAADAPNMYSKPVEAISTFVASRKSHIFHTSSCPFTSLITEGNVVRFSTAGEAREAGRRPCKRCTPR